MIFVSDVPASCLFDFGYTHSFVAFHFAPQLHVAPACMEIRLSVATPVTDSLDTDVIYWDCVIRVED